MMATRCPELAETLLLALETNRQAQAPSSKVATEAKAALLEEGCGDCPSWRELYHGKRPPDTEEKAEPGEY